MRWSTAAWLDDVWCEGAALVDHDQRRLCFFTSHHEGHDERAAILAVLARTWPGWQIDWAYDGLADLVTHVGQDPAIVRSEGSLEEVLVAAEDDQVWPGWHWEMWEDRRDEQRTRTAGRISIPEPDLATALAALREGFLRVPQHDPVTAAREFLSRMEAMDATTVASPHLLDHTQTSPSDAERSTVLEAIAELSGTGT